MSRTITVRVSDDEAAAFESAARIAQLKIGPWLRRLGVEASVHKQRRSKLSLTADRAGRPAKAKKAK